jgi:hypothetical protein
LYVSTNVRCFIKYCDLIRTNGINLKFRLYFVFLEMKKYFLSQIYLLCPLYKFWVEYESFAPFSYFWVSVTLWFFASLLLLLFYLLLGTHYLHKEKCFHIMREGKNAVVCYKISSTTCNISRIMFLPSKRLAIVCTGISF